MRKAICYFALTVFAIQASALSAQTTEKPASPFRLELSLGHGDGSTSKSLTVLSVKITNVSDHVAYQSFCWAVGGPYRFDVKFNGVPVPETEEYQKILAYKKTHLCDIRGRTLDPGSSWTDKAYYDATKPV